MKKAMLLEPGKFGILEEQKPEPGPDEVRLKVHATGVCGTDIEVFKGNFPDGWDVVFPFQLGHELSGTIDAVGSNVPDSFHIGDRVVPDGRIACGYCKFCRIGRINACENMGYNSGGLREYSIYSYKSLVHIPDDVSFQAAAMAEPVSCTVYGNGKLDISVGDFGVVIGDGAIGLLHAQLLRSRGAEVAVVGLLPHRLKAAEKLGFKYVIDAGKEDPVEKISTITGGYGADQVVVAAGTDVALRQSLSIAGRYGQVLFFAATMKDSCSMPMDLIHYKELSVIGSYDSTTAHFAQALQAISSGAIDAEALITHTFPMTETQNAYESAKAGTGIKTIIVTEE